MIEAARIVINIDTNAQRASRSMGQLDKSTRAAEQSAGKASKAFASLKAIGIAAFAGVAARSIARLGGSLVEAASDAAETLSKFNVTFQGINDEAEATAQSLTENFGLAQAQARGLLADTGDLLIGFGFTRESALELSTQVQTLAVDLASFENYAGGATGASDALTRALLGERESMKSLGIAITDADLDRLAEERGIVDELTRQQQAMLTLDIAIRQSGNAIGDFARTSHELAGQQRMLYASVQELRVELGNVLLPVVTDIVSAIRDLVERFNETDEATKKMIVIAGVLAAAIAGVTAAAGALGVALAVISANPIVLGLTAVVAGIAGIAVAVNSARAAGAEELFDTAAEKLTEAAESGEDLIASIKEVAAETGLSVDQVISLAEQQGFVTGEMREQVELLRKQASVTGQVEQSARDIAAENEKLSGHLAMAARLGYDMEESARSFATDLGYSKQRVLALALELDNLTDTQRDQLANLQDFVDATEYARSVEHDRTNFAKAYADARERATSASEAEAEAAEAAAEAEVEKTQELIEQQRIEDKYQAGWDEIVRILGRGNTEIEKLEASLLRLQDLDWGEGPLEEGREEAVQILIQRLKELYKTEGEGFADREEAAERAAKIEKEAADRLFEQSATEIEMLKRQYDIEIAEAEEAGASTLAIREFYAGQIARVREEEDRHAAEIEKNAADRLFEQGATRVEMIKRERDIEIAEAERAGAEILAIEKYYAEELRKAREEEAEAKKTGVEEFLEWWEENYVERQLLAARDLVSQLVDLANTRLDAEIAGINTRREAALAAIDEEIEAAKDAGEDYEHLLDERADITEDFDERIGAIEREQAVREKKMGIIAAIINTAVSVTRALASATPPWSWVLAAANAAMGAAEIATIAAQPIPQAQFGGSFVVPPGNNDDSGLLRVNSGEEVNVTPARGGEGGFPDRIIVSIGGAEFDARVAAAFNKGSAQIRRRGAVQVNR